jgi:hypothetical protein
MDDGAEQFQGDHQDEGHREPRYDRAHGTKNAAHRDSLGTAFNGWNRRTFWD